MQVSTKKKNTNKENNPKPLFSAAYLVYYNLYILVRINNTRKIKIKTY
jgi:hypothetical protein